MSTFIAILRMLAFLLLSVPVVPCQMLVLLFHKGRHAYLIPHLWHKCVCFIFGIRVRVQGNISVDTQTLFVSNHISYLDIPAIASVLKEASFVAKADVARWPVFGFLSKLQQTAFISRARADAAKVAGSLDSMLEDGKNLIIFPEGTSTDGREVRPFKSSLFSLALADHQDSLTIQPMSLRVLKTNGTAPKTQDERDIYSWHVDMETELPEHLWRFAKNQGSVLEIIFHEPIAAKDFQDRKRLAKTCHDTVSNGLEI